MSSSKLTLVAVDRGSRISGTSLHVVLFLIFGTVLLNAQTSKLWPPPGPAWETDKQKAFARARVERKQVIVYVGNGG